MPEFKFTVQLGIDICDLIALLTCSNHMNC